MHESNPLHLHHGDLTFSAHEQGTGPVVLCLHGFPDHARSFRHQLPALAEAGYRAIAPTIRGYEPSSQPADGDYHIIRMAEDVVAWLDDLGEERAHLVGHDWGAAIVHAAGALAPERFHSLTTLALPHPGRFANEAILKLPGQLLNSWYMLFFQLRGLADWAVERNDWALIERLWRIWSPGWELPPEEMAGLKRTLAQPGVKKAALGYYRAMFDRWTAAGRATQDVAGAPLQVPTLALTGARDGCIDTRLHDLLFHEEDYPAGHKLVRVEGAGHFLHQEKPDEVTPVIVDWIRQHSPSGA